MADIAVIDDPAAAVVSLDPVRARLLAALAEPGSATTLSGQLGIPRQKINYHLRTLEQHGLLELVEERRKGNCTERVLKATASSYLISPVVLADVGPGQPAYDEEIFGPVAAIVAAEDEADAIRIANSSEFGLGSGVVTADLDSGPVIAQARVRILPRDDPDTLAARVLLRVAPALAN